MPRPMTLSPEAVADFVECYLQAAGVSDGQAAADLRARRDGWELYERLFSSLHFRLMAQRTSGRARERYATALADITAGLASWTGC